MPEDPVEDNPLEIPGMTRVDRPKTPIGEIDPEEQERFKKVATGWMERDKKTRDSIGINFAYRLVPENLLAIDFIDYSKFEPLSYSLEGQQVMRSYYPTGVESDFEVSARVILEKKDDDKGYRVGVVFKDIEDMNDHRNLRIGGNYLSFTIQSPVLTTTIMYGEGGSLDGFEFEGRESIFSNPDELDYPEPDMVDLHLIYHSVKHGGNSYDAETGEHIDFNMDDDPDYAKVTCRKDDKVRVIKVPIRVDLPKIREELEEGLNLEDPFNDPPEADRWLGKDLEKVVGIVEVPMGTHR